VKTPVANELEWAEPPEWRRSLLAPSHRPSNNQRMPRVMLLGLTATAVAAALAASMARPAGSARVAITPVEQQIAREVHLMFSVWAGDPNSGIVHGTPVVLLPICVSSVDRRFALVVANPVVRGVVGQSGLLYVRRVAGGYRVLGDLLTGDRMNKRPTGMPKSVYSKLYRSCNLAPSPRAVLKARAAHTAPVFVS
jgi:hypothetical protein